MPHEKERNLIACPHHEFRARGEAATVGWHRSPQRHCIGSRNRLQMAVQPSHPRHDRAVIESEDKLHLHRYLASDPLHDPNQVWLAMTRRHEVNDPRCPRRCFERRFEYQGVGTVASLTDDFGGRWTHGPAAVTRIAQKCLEAGAGVEPREAEPVDRSIAPDEGGGLCVTNQAIVFYTQRHVRTFARGESRVRSLADWKFEDLRPQKET